MREYIISIACVCIIGALVCALAPDGEGGGLSRHTRLVYALCLVLVCAAPLRDVMDRIAEFEYEDLLPSTDKTDEYESIFNSSYSEAELDNLCVGIKDILSSKFGIDASSCSVSVRAENIGTDGKTKLTQIYITLYGDAIWTDTGAIEQYLGSLFGCTIITAIGEF